MADKKIKKIYRPEEKAQETKKLLRVAAYCRVSTKSDEQLTSYETQMAVYTQKISENPDWVFAGIYADEEHSYPALFRAAI